LNRYRFPKSVRLLRAVDFRRVYAEGRRRNLDGLVAFSLPTGRPSSRVGFTVPAAFGTAVERNRIKRCLREAIRRRWRELEPGWDLVLNPRRVALDWDSLRIEETIGRLFRACGRRRDQPGPAAGTEK
jgi:ribonuclease P protein component